MNKEAVFALRFVMKDFAKMRKGIEQMNKNLEDLKKRSNAASTGFNNLNNSVSKSIRSLAKFALSYLALSKIMSVTFKKANESIQIDLMAQSAGVAADKIGKLGKALRSYGGDAKSAGSAYNSLTDIIGGAQHGMGVSQDIAKVNAMYGIGFNYGNISQDELMTNIAVRMKELRAKGDQWAINQIASAYGLDAPMAEFLTKHGANWNSERNKEDWQKLSISETQKLINATDDLETQIAEFGKEFFSLLKELVSGVTEIVKYINAKINKSQPVRDKDGNIVALKTSGFGEIPAVNRDSKDISMIGENKYSMLGSWKLADEKVKSEIRGVKNLMDKYKDIPNAKYSHNWLTGENRVVYDLDMTVKNSSNSQVYGTVSSENRIIKKFDVPGNDTK